MNKAHAKVAHSHSKRKQAHRRTLHRVVHTCDSVPLQASQNLGERVITLFGKAIVGVSGAVRSIVRR